MTLTAQATLERLTDRVRGEGGLLAAALLPGGPAVPAHDPELGALAAAGPRAASDPATFAFVVEAVREAHLLHGGNSRLIDAGDRDLAILAGDRLYALGLAELAAIGAVDAVRELADVIALSAQARASDDDELAEAAWAAGVAAIGWGSSDGLERAKSDARAGMPGAARGLNAAAARRHGRTPPAR